MSSLITKSEETLQGEMASQDREQEFMAQMKRESILGQMDEEEAKKLRAQQLMRSILG